MAKSVLYIHPDLHRKVKAAAAMQGQSIRDFTETALQAYMEVIEEVSPSSVEVDEPQTLAAG